MDAAKKEETEKRKGNIRKDISIFIFKQNHNPKMQNPVEYSNRVCSSNL